MLTTLAVSGYRSLRDLVIPLDRLNLGFPEVDADSLNHVQWMDITVVTTAGDDAKAQALLLGLGMPFQQPAGAGPGTGKE